MGSKKRNAVEQFLPSSHVGQTGTELSFYGTTYGGGTAGGWGTVREQKNWERIVPNRFRAVNEN